MCVCVRACVRACVCVKMCFLSDRIVSFIIVTDLSNLIINGPLNNELSVFQFVLLFSLTRTIAKSCAYTINPRNNISRNSRSVF